MAPYGAHLVLAMALTSALLAYSKNQPPSCNTCYGLELEPVCTSRGVTLPSPCLAICQGLKVARMGPCDASDPLAGSLTLEFKDGGSGGDDLGRGPLRRRAAMSAPAGSSGSAGSSGDAEDDGDGSGSSDMDDIAKRFEKDGFVYAGQAKVTDEGPSGQGQAGFVSSLPPPLGPLRRVIFLKPANHNRLHRDPKGAAAGGSSSSSVGSSNGTSSTGQPPTPQRLYIRAVRFTTDGAVYLESSPFSVDLTALPTNGQTENRIPPDDATGGGTAAALRDPRVLLQQHLQPQQRVRRPIEDEAASDGYNPFSGDDSDGVDGGVSGGSLLKVQLAQQQLQSQGQRQRRRRRRLVDDRYRADVRMWPHNVIGQLTYRMPSGLYVCSGTWISPYDVLTAAHCVFNIESKAEARNFVFEPGKIGYIAPLGAFDNTHVTFYRAEYPRADDGGVNYFDIALIRMRSSTPYYMGIKYSCAQIDYPRTQTCGYVQEGGNYQKCDECYFTTNGCYPGVQPINWCFTAAGQSGSAIYDLFDSQVLGVLSGGFQAADLADYSLWTPIDALHFASLTRWMWPSGDDSRVQLPAAPPPLPQPLRTECKSGTLASRLTLR
ncbi:hypothetical protein VOLCADRAFT_99351 [Volvox carteri f. nagariensis]|uniref:Kazal-like domain-containing protein n=1 Tax=Volvox carteri f. nagariensis TaxID=3068 RepID=D8UHL4_VOLCA|nr:uncharacterized protein VOLCADRAFT_99351 [Volvox carteri f. nagariensis]EFJ40765.1 hypothetical protein VOLCADRAFT_99351 [Volvox carteri f. nagariensis]|eukprot:XP_002958140.1 hypothetical protein VOLCADRAFT_99351 [Volvox carteri f. nagariensis]